MHLPPLRSSGPMSILQTPINASRQLECLLTCELPTPNILRLQHGISCRAV